ncbi:diaminopimelate decarboxylase [Lysobacter yangpyeongensis]|uniref:Diaminopimelate decarboxylase n=1 Tax=Lysobacter yangpyeongensis TaxID=346182 RepID=A0ABW0SL40_9GAMM
MTIYQSFLPAAGTLDGVDLPTLAAHLPTPFYAYSASAIRNRVTQLQQALKGLDARLCFAVKANSNIGVLNLMAGLGVGADIVSLGELRRAQRAGIAASRIVFSGVGKTEEEIAAALVAGVWRFNLESADELALLQAVARRQGVIARAAVRVNPDVDARTHAKISTGKAENKFGVGFDEARIWFDDAARYPNVRLDGLHAHIGSQILELAPFEEALGRLATFWRELRDDGHIIESIDVGGGLGVCYRAGTDRPLAVADYVAAIRRGLEGYRGRIVLEPGRHLVAEAGVLVTRVIRVKHGQERDFLVLDAAMNDLMRPALYDAWHDMHPLHAEPRPLQRYDVVGPVCETGDTFARDRQLPRCEAGDLLLIAGAGAYGASMGSNYNSRPLPAEVLLDGGRYAVVRRRQSFEQMLAGEQLPQAWHAA